MIKKILLFFTLAAFIITPAPSGINAEEEPSDAASEAAAQPAAKAPAGQKKKPPVRPRPRGFAAVFGSVTAVDRSDPNNPVLTIKSGQDDSLHDVIITPRTNFTKIADIDDIAAGDIVRVMTRKENEKDIAVTVVFGKIQKLFRRRPPKRAEKKEPAAQQ